MLELNDREVVVLRQILEAIPLPDTDGPFANVRDELKDIRDRPYVKDFKPGPGQVRLSRQEWDVFCQKILMICDAKADDTC